jgi:hypothetical protein
MMQAEWSIKAGKVVLVVGLFFWPVWCLGWAWINSESRQRKARFILLHSF